MRAVVLFEEDTLLDNGQRRVDDFKVEINKPAPVWRDDGLDSVGVGDYVVEARGSVIRQHEKGLVGAEIDEGSKSVVGPMYWL